MSNQANGERSAKSGRTKTVSIAAGECHQGETGERNTATRPANSRLTVPDKWHQVNPLLRLPIANVTARQS
jgi:hypothetical protein